MRSAFPPYAADDPSALYGVDDPQPVDAVHPQRVVDDRHRVLACGLQGRSGGRRGEHDRSERDEHRSFCRVAAASDRAGHTAIMSDIMSDL